MWVLGRVTLMVVRARPSRCQQVLTETLIDRFGVKDIPVIWPFDEHVSALDLLPESIGVPTEEVLDTSTAGHVLHSACQRG